VKVHLPAISVVDDIPEDPKLRISQGNQWDGWFISILH
jgi:hypothetical protein